MSYLQICDLECQFGAFLAVDQLSLEFNEGEFVALLGPSGCGKTTTLRSIAGFIKPTSGTIKLAGRQLNGPSTFAPPEQREMSMIFQSYAIWPHMTVFANVAFGLKIRKLSKEEVLRRTNRILEVVKLDHLAQRLPGELSGGQQQRVALARAIVVEPKVLLLDEPLSNLDASLREEMRFEIRRLHDEFGITSAYVTHDQSEAMVTADRIVVMNQGKIEQVASPQELYLNPKTKFVADFIGQTNLVEGQLSQGVFEAGPIKIAVDNAPKEAHTLSVRPHSISMKRKQAADKSDPFKLKASVSSRVFMGSTWEYEVDVPDLPNRLRVSRPPNEDFDVGDAVTLELDPADLRCVI